MKTINIVKAVKHMPIGRHRWIEVSRLNIRNARILATNEDEARAEAKRLYGDARLRFRVMRDASKLLASADKHGASESRPYWLETDEFGNRMLMVPDSQNDGMRIASCRR